MFRKTYVSLTKILRLVKNLFYDETVLFQIVPELMGFNYQRAVCAVIPHVQVILGANVGLGKSFALQMTHTFVTKIFKMTVQNW